MKSAHLVNYTDQQLSFESLECSCYYVQLQIFEQNNQKHLRVQPNPQITNIMGRVEFHFEPFSHHKKNKVVKPGLFLLATMTL